MKTPDELKRETDELLEAEREQRIDREARARRDGPILDAFDRMQSGRPLASGTEPPPRHPPRLQIVEVGRGQPDAVFDVSDIDDAEPCSHVFDGDSCDRCGAPYNPAVHGHRVIPEAS